MKKKTFIFISEVCTCDINYKTAETNWKSFGNVFGFFEAY